MKSGEGRLRSSLPRLCVAMCCLGTALVAMGQDMASMTLRDMSLKDLGQLMVTSVSKSPEPLDAAAAAIFVITQADIERAGVTTLAEALRLAPNLRVMQLSSSNYTLSARGFGGSLDAQNFSNKLLLLIDGRSVYTPLFSGIYTDTQDVPLASIERIEVISGPGGTLWGANAMNGVINVITKAAYLTEGPSVSAIAGTQDLGLTAQYGAQAGEQTAYRVYAKAYQRDAMSLADGGSAEDGWRRAQGGFRLDTTLANATATVQGDVYVGHNDNAGPGRESVSGANVLGRWQGQTERSTYQIQGYFDHVQRGAPNDGLGFVVNTSDLEAQQSLALGSINQLVWGAGVRLHRYEIANSESLLFVPSSRWLHVWNLFAEDTLALTQYTNLSLGVKLEHNSFSGWELQPEVRLAWQAGESTLLWAAASRAVRAPTPFDTNVQEKLGDLLYLVGQKDFRSEDVRTYEAGVRSRFSPRFSLSLSAFYNEYEDLRTVEPADSSTFLPLHWDNLMRGHTYGMSAWATWQVTDRWRLAPGLALLEKRLQWKPGASELLDVGQAGNDPEVHALINSSLRLGANKMLDVTLSHVGRLPEPELAAFTELSARFSWQATNRWELSVRGVNLLHERHQEYPGAAGAWIQRSVMAEARWSR